MTAAFRRAWLAATGLLALLIVIASLAPQDLVAPAGEADKLHHFAAYFVLTAMAAGVAAAAAVRWIAAAAFLLGLLLEIAQGAFTVDRTADWADLAANAAGILAAWLLTGRRGAGWARYVAARLPGARPE